MDDMILKLAKAINDAGGTLYLVGGCVRDKVLNKEPKDIDVEIHGLPEEKLLPVLETFGKVKKQGKSFPIFIIKGCDIEIALPRTARSAEEDDNKVFVDPFMGTKEASKRRDFTMNALMYEPLTDTIVDHWGGCADIETKVIRHVDDVSFVEDPLRVLRTARFASQLGFDELCRNIDISVVFRERIFEETKKALMSQNPSIYFEVLRDMDQLDYWYPELKSLIGVRQKAEYHQEDVWQHTMMVIDELAKIRNYADFPLEIMFAGLFHDVGKPKELKERARLQDEGKAEIMYNDEFRHEYIGTAISKVALRRFSNVIFLERYVSDMVCNHMHVMIAFNSKSRDKKVLKILDEAKYTKDLLVMEYADLSGRIRNSDELAREKDRYKDWSQKAFDIYAEFSAKEHIEGEDLIELGLKPSPELAEWLKRARLLEYSLTKDRSLQQLRTEIRKSLAKRAGD